MYDFCRSHFGARRIWCCTRYGAAPLPPGGNARGFMGGASARKASGAVPGEALFLDWLFGKN
jgi:hypothetical protein